MTEVVSIKFKNRGRSYFFAPNGLVLRTGDRAVVETSKGLEIAVCSHGNHFVDDTAVVKPLLPVARIATEDDLRVEEINRRREKEALEICEKKIAEHGLEMKLVDAECNFEGNKLTFYFTAENRVDFRELVKDLAGIFRTRIELRQIGVRDETKLLGGIGPCGRPFCCTEFLEEFSPVSTKMAKVQSLSLNPAKISGACGRLMCCLRYEQEAYEDLVRKVPKQGAFVETIDGYGTAVQVNLLRQTVKVRLDSDTDDSLHVYKANELCTVPGGRPKDGSEPPHVLNYVPPEPEEEEVPESDPWESVSRVIPEAIEIPGSDDAPEKRSRRARRRKKPAANKPAETAQDKAKEAPAQPQEPKSGKTEAKVRPAGQGGKKRSRSGKKATVKPVRIIPAEAKTAAKSPAKAEERPAGDKRPSRSARRRRSRGKKTTQGE